MTEQATEAEGDEQTFVSHLIELRTRLIHAVVAVFVVFALLFPFSNPLYTLLATPLLLRLPESSTMIAIDVVAPFIAPVKLAFFTAIFATMPYLLYQAWAFVAPGLYRHEKRFAMPLLVSATLLFYVGCAFAYFLVMPLVFNYLTMTAPEGVAMMTDISAYLDFVLVLFLAFGLCFEIPVATVILVLLGVTTVEDLRKSRGYVWVGAFVVAAVLTPPDAVSQLLLAFPMCGLFEIGLIVARLMTKHEAEVPAE